jgi:predicted transcriptional regulator
MLPVSVQRKAAGRKPLTVRLDPNLERRLHQAAVQEGVSVSEFVREAISDRIDRGAADSSLWDRIAPSVVKETARTTRAREGSAHAELAEGLEAEAATKWRRLDK